RDDLVGDERPDHVAREFREARPVRAELVAHDNAGDDAEPEGHGEDLYPEPVEVAVDRLTRAQPIELERREPARKPDREGRKDDVEAEGEGELDTGEQERVEFHQLRPAGRPRSFRPSLGRRGAPVTPPVRAAAA